MPASSSPCMPRGGGAQQRSHQSCLAARRECARRGDVMMRLHWVLPAVAAVLRHFRLLKLMPAQPPPSALLPLPACKAAGAFRGAGQAHAIPAAAGGLPHSNIMGRRCAAFPHTGRVPQHTARGIGTDCNSQGTQPLLPGCPTNVPRAVGVGCAIRLAAQASVPDAAAN